jgi:hypothetical protein
MTNTTTNTTATEMQFRKTKAGNKVHAAYAGSVASFCGLRAQVGVQVHMTAQFCSHCVPGANIAASICRAFASLRR